MAHQTNVVVLMGNLTADPELRSLPSGTSVCKLRVANNRRFKEGASGEWKDRVGYYDVTVWGSQADNCARYLSKGRPVLVTGELRWREWESEQGKRSATEINASSVQFLNSGDGQQNQQAQPQQIHPMQQAAAQAQQGYTGNIPVDAMGPGAGMPPTDVPASPGDFAPAPQVPAPGPGGQSAVYGDDDIPF